MGSRLGVSQRLVQAWGGFSESVFPRLALALENSEFSREALLWVAQKKKVDRYASLVDFLFCEFFPFYRNTCFLFYEDSRKYRGLKDRLSDDELADFQDVLMYGLSYAEDLYRKRIPIPWSTFVGRVKKIIC